MFERHKFGGSAVLVHINFTSTKQLSDLGEFKELVSAAGAEQLYVLESKKEKPEAKFFLGKGKVLELKDIVTQLGADVVIFNHDLSPGQERNLEKELCCRVLGRTGLILDIFAQRALTFEGKLQVELAQLRHISTRLIRGWTHLERQKGGIGLRGPGETQLESDRRIIKDKIKSIELKLDKVKKQRSLHRKSRQKSQVLTIALVGYTNAGKSTLFNTITSAKVFASDMLFATLDPTLRAISLPILGKAFLVDTVGFVRDLPHQLVAAFGATLEETKKADLLLHVVDASCPSRMEKIVKVNEVLKEVGADKVRQLVVYNKVDLTSNKSARVVKDDEGEVRELWISSLQKDSTELLAKVVAELLAEDKIIGSLTLLPSEYAVKEILQKNNAIHAEHVDENGNYILELCVNKIFWQRFCKSHRNIAEKFCYKK